MSSINSETKILVDADVIRHFIYGSSLIALPRIYPNRLVILDEVKKELSGKAILPYLNMLLSTKGVESMGFPPDQLILREYAQLKKQGRGSGESACMAVAKFGKQFIASSNLLDIKTYCQDNSIAYLTTMNILGDALILGILSEAECDAFITKVRAVPCRLPFFSMKEYFIRDAKGRIQNLQLLEAS